MNLRWYDVRYCMQPVVALLLLGAVFAAVSPASAFTFRDGTKTECIARGQVVPEIYAPPEHEISRLGRIGMTVTNDDKDYMIIWNTAKLNELPPAIHDLLFFHECAHAQVPTPNEIQANCAGLKAMRAAKRAGFAIENKVAVFYQKIAASAYWEATLKCANGVTQSGSK